MKQSKNMFVLLSVVLFIVFCVALQYCPALIKAGPSLMLHNNTTAMCQQYCSLSTVTWRYRAILSTFFLLIIERPDERRGEKESDGMYRLCYGEQGIEKINATVFKEQKEQFWFKWDSCYIYPELSMSLRTLQVLWRGVFSTWSEVQFFKELKNNMFPRYLQGLQVSTLSK